MTRAALRVVTDSGQVRSALSPLRRALLERLRQPASATELAKVLGLPRQRVNYHVRELEREGLVELVEERQRRGCTERVVLATADAFRVEPVVMGAQPAIPTTTRERARFAAEHLVTTAAELVRDVGRQAAEAGAAGARLLTFTVGTEVAFATPADVHRFSGAVAEALATLADEHGSSKGARYRVVVGGHPAPRPDNTRRAR